MTKIRHVLFDADGVLQHIPGGWNAAIEPYLNERADEFLLRAWEDELPSLAGEGDYFPLLEAALLDYGVSTPVEDVYAAVWTKIELIEETFEVVDAIRRLGYGVHLGTNQEPRRGDHMRNALGYDSHFQVSCYSWELGVAKPDPRFFLEAARRIGAEPSEILFIDDSTRNVEGARQAGLEAEQYVHTSGQGALLDLLARQGIDVELSPREGRA